MKILRNLIKDLNYKYESEREKFKDHIIDDA